jgi:glutamine synthetase
MATSEAHISRSEIVRQYTELDQKGIIIAEYIWIDSEGNTRSKTRTLEGGQKWDVSTLPIWNFDGSSTGQAPGENSDVYLRPCAVYPDPFRKGDNIL